MHLGRGKKKQKLIARKKTLAWLLVLVLLSSERMALTQSESGKWPCGGHPKLLRNSLGKPIWVKSRELEKQAIYKVEPKWPCCSKTSGVIKVDLLIDPEGKVVCARVTKGHPLLRDAAIQAAQQWKFKPIISDGESVAVMGRLFFPYYKRGVGD